MEVVAGVFNLFLAVMGIVLICSAVIGVVGFLIDVIRFPPKKSRIEKYYNKLDEISQTIDKEPEPKIKASEVEIDVDIDSIIEEV